MMKKLHLLAFAFLFSSVAMNAQIDIFDMEITAPATKVDVVVEPSGPGQATKPVVSVVADPAGRPGSSVKYVKTTGSAAWNALQAKYVDGTTELGSYNLDVNRYFKFKVYSETLTNFTILIQIGSPDPGNFLITKTVTQPLNTWVEYEIDLTAAGSGVVINNPTGFNSFTRFRFNDAVGAGEVYYVDDVSASPVATLSTNSIELKSVGVYPNPASDVLNINTDKEFKSVQIIDMLGKTVRTFNDTKVLSISDLNSGVYILETDTGLQAKFIKN